MQLFHITQAHLLWKTHLKKGDIAIDATLGNGHDSLFLAKLILDENCGFLYGYDIQKKALENSQKLLTDNLNNNNILNRIKLFLFSHENFENINHTRINLIVYNLGYLPVYISIINHYYLLF